MDARRDDSQLRRDDEYGLTTSGKLSLISDPRFFVSHVYIYENHKVHMQHRPEGTHQYNTRPKYIYKLIPSFLFLLDANE